VVRVFKDCVGSICVLFNANNIGYWANQFMVIHGKLVYKSKTPLFFDPSEDLSGSYTFFCQNSNGVLSVQELEIVTHVPATDDEKYRLSISLMADATTPWVAVSGYPLIRNGIEVWQDALRQAWDPKLIYHIGDPTDMRRGDILNRLREADIRKQDIMRHGMTVLGITENGAPRLFVAEEFNGRSRGVSLGEAAQVMKRLNSRDAIVLGAKGDAQLVSTLEGVIANPLVSSHDNYSARRVDNLGYRSRLVPIDCVERPIPGIVALEASSFT